jgi:hypothetical protein
MVSVAYLEKGILRCDRHLELRDLGSPTSSTGLQRVGNWLDQHQRPRLSLRQPCDKSIYQFTYIAFPSAVEHNADTPAVPMQ